MTLILASKSQIRQHILKQAGVRFITEVAQLNEDDWKQGKKLHPSMIAQQLAAEKSCQVSNLNNESYVIGADQTLGLNEKLFNKPNSQSEARQQLVQLRGKTHELYSALSCYYRGQEVWSCVERASLTMRNFSNKFLDAYLTRQGDDVMSSVGGYKMEQEGIQLFEKIEGDYFTILGMPLLPLLTYLRKQNLIPS